MTEMLVRQLMREIRNYPEYGPEDYDRVPGAGIWCYSCNQPYNCMNNRRQIYRHYKTEKHKKNTRSTEYIHYI